MGPHKTLVNMVNIHLRVTYSVMPHFLISGTSGTKNQMHPISI